MTGGRCSWLGLLLLLTPTVTLPGTTPQDALEAIDACVQRLNPDADTGYDRIVARCPNLARRLNESGLSVWLPREWQQPRNDLSVGGLRELRGLLERELTPNPPQRVSVLSVARVPAVLASLEREDPERSSWWARTRTWLRGLFETPAAGSAEGWLNHMIGQSGLSQAVIELVSYVALMFVVLLAVAIVANELYRSRVWVGLRRRVAILTDAPTDPRRKMLSWEDVQRAERPQRPGLLLELLAAHLVGAPRGLTARELARTAQLTNEEDRSLLLALAETAERLRFSNTEVPEEALARALEGGRLLLERMGPS
jgi:hypothetical protein